jgi:hypothetical protein
MTIHQLVTEKGDGLVIITASGEEVVVTVAPDGSLVVKMPDNLSSKIETDNYTVDFNPSLAIIKVTYRGSLDMDTRKHVVDQLDERFALPNPLKILLDVNQLEMDWSIAQQAEFAQYVASHERLSSAKVAVVHKPEHNPNWFIDTCAFNRGCLVAQFTREKHAEEWLATETAA